MKPRFWLTMVCWALACLLLSLSQPACTTCCRFRARANGWIDVENPHLARPLLLLSEARNSIRLVLDRSHLWSSRMRGLREILVHPVRRPVGHRSRSEFAGLPIKAGSSKQQRALPQEIF